MNAPEFTVAGILRQGFVIINKKWPQFSHFGSSGGDPYDPAWLGVSVRPPPPGPGGGGEKKIAPR